MSCKFKQISGVDIQERWAVPERAHLWKVNHGQFCVSLSRIASLENIIAANDSTIEDIKINAEDNCPN